VRALLAIYKPANARILDFSYADYVVNNCFFQTVYVLIDRELESMIKCIHTV